MNGRKVKIIDGSTNSELVISMTFYDYMADS